METKKDNPKYTASELLSFANKEAEKIFNERIKCREFLDHTGDSIPETFKKAIVEDKIHSMVIKHTIANHIMDEIVFNKRELVFEDHPTIGEFIDIYDYVEHIWQQRVSDKEKDKWWNMYRESLPPIIKVEGRTNIDKDSVYMEWDDEINGTSAVYEKLNSGWFKVEGDRITYNSENERGDVTHKITGTIGSYIDQYNKQD